MGFTLRLPRWRARLFALFIVCWPLTTTAGPSSVAVPVDMHVEVSTLDGRRVLLSSLADKVTVVNFWATWCFPCRFEMPLLHRLHKRLNGQGVSVVAIAVDDELQAVREYQDKTGVAFTIVFDGTGAAKTAFGVDSVPESYIIDGAGRAVPFPDSQSGQPSTLITNPMVWQDEALASFLLRLAAER